MLKLVAEEPNYSEIGLNFPKEIKISGSELSNYLSKVILETFGAETFSLVKGELSQYTFSFKVDKPISDQIPGCLHNMGCDYNLDNPSEKEVRLALTFFRIAAELGHSESMNNIGGMYSDGIGVKEDLDQALFWYHRGVEKGNAACFLNLGILYMCGKGVEKDLKKAAYYYSIAAKGGLTQAMNSLGLMYLKGEGVVQDETESYRYFKEAAELENKSATHNLASLILNGFDGNDRNPKKAVEYYKKAGLKTSYESLSEMYRIGDGVEKSPALVEHYSFLASRMRSST